MYRAITSPASRHNISLINIFLILSTPVNMLSVQIAIGGCKFTTMGTGAEFCFCVDNSDVAQDCISCCLNQITSTAFIFAHTIHIKPDGCPLAGWHIMCTRYGSVSQCGWTMGRCRGGCGWARGRCRGGCGWARGRCRGGHGWARGRCRGGQTGVTGDGGRTGASHMFTRRSCSYGGNFPRTHHSCIQKGAQCSQRMFGNCLLYNCQPLVLHLQSLYLFCYALPEQPNPFYSFPSLLLIHPICPCQQSKYLASFTPL